MEKEGNVKKDLLGIFYSKICFSISFFYTVVARVVWVLCSGGGMVDTYVSDAYAFGCVGSSPISSTRYICPGDGMVDVRP